jgi:hypothetical protein
VADSRRRQSTLRVRRHLAADASPVALEKTIELERRLSRLEVSQQEIVERLTVLLKRTTALQAQLDHLSTKFTHLP